MHQLTQVFGSMDASIVSILFGSVNASTYSNSRVGGYIHQLSFLGRWMHPPTKKVKSVDTLALGSVDPSTNFIFIFLELVDAFADTYFKSVDASVTLILFFLSRWMHPPPITLESADASTYPKMIIGCIRWLEKNGSTCRLYTDCCRAVRILRRDRPSLLYIQAIPWSNGYSMTKIENSSFSSNKIRNYKQKYSVVFPQMKLKG